MARSEEEALEGQSEIVEPEEISATAYRMYLLETRWGFQTKLRDAEGLLGRLDVALEDRKLRVYLFESEEGVQMTTQEKDQLGFHRTQMPDPTPEGGKRISATRFRNVMEGSRQGYLNQISQLESLLEALDDALKNREIRVRCFQTDDGAGMEIEEKGPMGFILHQEES